MENSIKFTEKISVVHLAKLTEVMAEIDNNVMLCDNPISLDEIEKGLWLGGFNLRIRNMCVGICYIYICVCIYMRLLISSKCCCCFPHACTLNFTISL